MEEQGGQARWHSTIKLLQECMSKPTDNARGAALAKAFASATGEGFQLFAQCCLVYEAEVLAKTSSREAHNRTGALDALEAGNKDAAALASYKEVTLSIGDMAYTLQQMEDLLKERAQGGAIDQTTGGTMETGEGQGFQSEQGGLEALGEEGSVEGEGDEGEGEEDAGVGRAGARVSAGGDPNNAVGSASRAAVIARSKAASAAAAVASAGMIGGSGKLQKGQDAMQRTASFLGCTRHWNDGMISFKLDTGFDIGMAPFYKGFNKRKR